MFARSVSIRLKPNSSTEFANLMEKEILPVLRKQKGFRDEISLIVPGGQEALGISLWDEKEQAEAYSRGSYAEVVKTLGRVVEGTPQVHTYEVSNSTFHKIAAHATV